MGDDSQSFWRVLARFESLVMKKFEYLVINIHCSPLGDQWPYLQDILGARCVGVRVQEQQLAGPPAEELQLLASAETFGAPQDQRRAAAGLLRCLGSHQCAALAQEKGEMGGQASSCVQTTFRNVTCGLQTSRQSTLCTQNRPGSIISPSI